MMGRRWSCPPNQMKNLAMLSAAAGLALAAFLPPCRAAGSDSAPRPVAVWASNAPYSSDPVDSDAYIHQVAFTSVFGWLVTRYQAGGYRGELAESWRSSPDFKEWRFVLREGMVFENGDRLRAQDVVDSWTRLARVLKAKGSDAGLFEAMAGYQDFPAKAARISGMTGDGASLTLRFTQPMPKLLDDISTGFYAVIHPSSYDRQTGRWLDPKKAISSGPYRVGEWDSHRFVLELRKDYPASLLHPRPLARVEVHWDAASRDRAEMVVGSSRDVFGAKGFLFYGGPESGIEFFRCQSWRDPSSPLASKDFRRRLRDLFYEELEKTPIKPVRSFFPLAIKGVHPFAASAGASYAGDAIPDKARIRYRQFNPSVAFLVSPAREALRTAAARLGLGFEVVEAPLPEVIEEWRTQKTNFKIDIVSPGTGIYIDEPDGDVSFMFKSQEGIRLPDPTGKAALAISRPHINVQEVNEVLWDDAIIWPVIHVSEGLWARPELDLSRVNVVLPPTAMHLIGWK